MGSLFWIYASKRLKAFTPGSELTSGDGFSTAGFAEDVTFTAGAAAPAFLPGVFTATGFTAAAFLSAVFFAAAVFAVLAVLVAIVLPPFGFIIQKRAELYRNSGPDR